MNNFLSSVLISIILSIGIVIMIAFFKSLGGLGEKILRVIVFFIFLGIAIFTVKVLVPDVFLELKKLKGGY